MEFPKFKIDKVAWIGITTNKPSIVKFVLGVG